MTYKLSNRPINNFSPATSRSYQSQIIELELRLTSTKLRVTKIKHFKVVKKNCLVTNQHMVSNIVYKFTYSICNATYYSEKCRHFKVRVGERSGISPLMIKQSKSKKSTAVKDHMLICDQTVSFDDFKVLASSNSEFHLKIKESLLILRDQPVLNKNEASLPLHLFD